MTVHKIHRREVVLTEIVVEAPDLSTAIDRAERGRYSQRHRTVLDSADIVAFPALEWPERVAEERAEMARRDAIVAEYDAAQERRMAVGEAGAA